MTIYEYSTIKVGVDGLEAALEQHSKAGWELVNVLPSVYSGTHQSFTELCQVLIVFRSKIGETGDN